MLKAGDRFGNYTVAKLLGQGGMGSVFLLENAEGGLIAAKILPPETAGDHEARKRFLREAELALGVEHPNLVRTYDVGEDPDTGLCYILMEYVPGGSLADRLDREGPLPINDAIRIAYQIASVLEVAYQKGVVHRDIKPENIMFSADGTPKLADLGIARGGSGTNTTTVTQTGMMIGTPAYMAPEQMLDSHHVDSRADIYSLGIVFYEMLTGQLPNPDDTVVQLMAKAVAGEPIPDVREMRPDVSASLAELIDFMCAMKVDERISTPGEVTAALSQIAHGHKVAFPRRKPVRGPAKAKKRRARRTLLVAGLATACLTVAALVGAGMFWQFRQKRAVVARPTASMARPKDAGRAVVVTNIVEKAVVVTNVVNRAAVAAETVRAKAVAAPTSAAQADVRRPQIVKPVVTNVPRHEVSAAVGQKLAKRKEPEKLAPAVKAPAEKKDVRAQKPDDGFEWSQFFPCDVPVGKDLAKVQRGKRRLPAVVEKEGKLAASLSEIQAASRELERAKGSLAAGSAVSRIDQAIDRFLKLKTSATGGRRLKALEAQTEVVLVAEAKVKLYEWLLSDKVADGPARDRLEAALRAANRDKRNQSEKMDDLKEREGVFF